MLKAIADTLALAGIGIPIGFGFMCGAIMACKLWDFKFADIALHVYQKETEESQYD